MFHGNVRHRYGSLSLLFLLVHFALISLSYSEETPRSSERRSFTNENAPPKIWFTMFLRNFTSDRDVRFEIRALKSIGIKPEDFDSITFYFEEIAEQVQSETDEAHYRIVCPIHSPQPQGSELFPIYNEIDEIRQAVHAKYLAIVAAELSLRGYDYFREMLKKMDIGFGVSYTEHRNAWGSPDRITINAEQFCHKLEDLLHK